MIGFDPSAYFERVGVADLAHGRSGLAALQTAQMRAMPFEGVDPFLGRIPSLDIPSLQRKLIHEQRGGYCFELNALLGAVLAAIGVPARRVLARVRMGAPSGGPRSHVAHIALEGGSRFLVDAGFGGPGPLVPLALDVDGPQEAPNGVYRLVPDARTGERVLQRATPDGWFSLFGFDETPVSDADIEAANFLCARWSGAPFRDHLMVNAWFGDTRCGLFDRSLTVETPDGRQTERIESRHALERALSEALGLSLKGQEIDAIWARLSTEAAPLAARC
jgi:N-hydroxyarylamine O-acetyltransferase